MMKRDTGNRKRDVVLIVDDDPLVLEVTRERLEKAGYDVHTREEALGTSQWVCTHQPDFLLLDVNMPALSGTELALLIRRRDATKATAIILHSSLPESELHSIARTTGAVGVVKKTSDERAFLGEFERVAAKYRG
jgi:CheY-like chemotaxis protein